MEQRDLPDSGGKPGFKGASALAGLPTHCGVPECQRKKRIGELVGIVCHGSEDQTFYFIPLIYKINKNAIEQQLRQAALLKNLRKQAAE